MLKIWGRADSSNVQAVMWGIGELGLDYERLDIGQRFGGTDTPEFIALNPNRTVPVLQDEDDLVIWESAAILRHLARKYAQSPFWPDALDGRARVDQWAEWAKVNVAGSFTVPVFWRVVRTASSKQNPDAIAAALNYLGKYLDIAEQQLSEHDFLAGDQFSLADIMIGHVLYRYFDIEIDRPDRPSLARYYERLKDRTTFREHVMVSYEALRVSD
ncbi:MAG: glutathione S-transferase family protein [Henriciella sp.]|uniref:glutathione S-transferase family protein n=1 Tax=Henriciella sp. TaxID=1968823 RepID=UPI003C76A8A1